MASLVLASIVFVGTHFLLSHPLRAPVVARIGERGFLIVYSLVAFAMLGWMVQAFRAAPPTEPFWAVGDTIWGIASVVMLLASVLLAGSLFGNPALVDPTGTPHIPDRARGVFAITRHPMMWSFALWGVAHIAVMPDAANIVLSVAIIVLALIGARLQDMKKAVLQPDSWPAWRSRTAYWPFAAGADWPGWGVAIGGTILWLAATWAHIPLAGWPAGIWRWVGS